MMTIEGAAGTSSTGMGIAMRTDAVSKNIQKQIANAQKKFQELSSREGMTMEEKMKKRQEIQQEITSLNQQLRQHQIEQRKEQQSKGASMEDMIGGRKAAKPSKEEGGGSGLSQAGMQAMISADASMKQAQAQGSVAANLEGTARVLKSEIHMDQGRGGNTEAKEKTLAEVEQKAVDASALQMNQLAEANHTMKEAAREESENRAEKSDGETEGRTDRAGREAGEAPANVTAESMQSVVYTHVDTSL